MSDELPINPQTKIGDLLDAYPQLEEVLIEQSAAFKKLKNPILRKTVAKLATLEAAAGMAKVPVGELVSVLRKAVGQGDSPDDETHATQLANDDGSWVASVTITNTIDATAIIESGQTPMPAVVAAAKELEAGQGLLITSKFRPTPLVEVLQKQNCRVYIKELAADEFETTVAK